MQNVLIDLSVDSRRMTTERFIKRRMLTNWLHKRRDDYNFLFLSIHNKL